MCRLQKFISSRRNAGTVTGGKQHIIRQYHGTAGLSVRLQAAIDHLQEVQLLVGGLERNIISGGALTALFRAKGRIGQNDIKIFQSLGALCEGIPQGDVSIHIVQIGVHQCQAMGFVHQLHTVERFVLLEICLTVRERVHIVMRIDIAVGCNHKAKSTAGRVYVHTDFDTKEKALSGAKAAEKGLK